MSVQGQAAQSTQGPPKSNGPMIDAVNTMAKLEPGIIGLEPNLVLTSIAVSMTRIARAMENIAGVANNASYDNARTREIVEKAVTATTGISNAVMNTGGAIDRLRVELERSK